MASFIQYIIPKSQTPDTLITATEEMSVQDALDLMIEHDFSQLPVVDKESKKPKGLITSDSILRTVSYFKTTLDKIKVSHAAFKVKAFCLNVEPSVLLNELKDTGAVPIVDETGKLMAIVTDYDTSEYYRQLAEDWVLAKKIETTLKGFIKSAYRNDEGNIDNEALQKAIEDITPSGNDLKNRFKQALGSYLNSAQLHPQPDTHTQLIDKAFTQHLLQKREVKAFDKLSLHEYILLFKEPWDNKYKAAFNDLEWKAIHKLLDEVRQTRNKIAHFQEVSSNQHKHLKFCNDLFDRHSSPSRGSSSLNDP